MKFKNWNAKYDKALEEVKKEYPSLHDMLKDLILVIEEIDARLDALE